MVSGNTAVVELEASVAATDDVVSLAATMLEEGATEVLSTSMFDVLLATALDGAEVAVLVGDGLVAIMLLLEDRDVLDS